MTRILIAALALATALPAAADEFTDTIDSALSAYRDNDVKGARAELDYAIKLLDSMKSASLAKLLPAPLPGWTREEAADEGEGAGMAMAMFGGGTAAAARYTDGTADMTITLVADSPMVSGFGAIMSGIAGAGGGKPIRIKRTQFTLNEGDLQGVVDNKVMVSVSGSASLEQKTAQIEAMDFEALGDF
jgi:hypothetical protein